jgi:hypothetical protein
MQAIEFSLAEYENRNTREKYRPEAERLLLWAVGCGMWAVGEFCERQTPVEP